MVGERGAFWKAGRAAGELDVYRIVELQLFGQQGETVARGICSETEDILEPQHAWLAVGADRDHYPQFRKPRSAQVTRRGEG